MTAMTNAILLQWDTTNFKIDSIICMFPLFRKTKNQPIRTFKNGAEAEKFYKSRKSETKRSAMTNEDSLYTQSPDKNNQNLTAVIIIAGGKQKTHRCEKRANKKTLEMTGKREAEIDYIVKSMIKLFCFGAE